MYEENQDVELRARVLRTILTSKARERLSNIRIVKPMLAEQIENYLIQLYQLNRITHTIDENEIIKILEGLNKKRDFRIRRK